LEINEQFNIILKDLNSANGTMVDGKAITANNPTKVKFGEKICLGESKKCLVIKGMWIIFLILLINNRN